MKKPRFMLLAIVAIAAGAHASTVIVNPAIIPTLNVQTTEKVGSAGTFGFTSTTDPFNQSLVAWFSYYAPSKALVANGVFRLTDVSGFGIDVTGLGPGLYNYGGTLTYSGDSQQWNNGANSAALMLLGPNGLNVASGALRLTPIAFASRVASPSEGMLHVFTDSNTATIGATIAGGGSNHVLGYYNGTNWVVK